MLMAILLGSGLAEVGFRAYRWGQSLRDKTSAVFRAEPDPQVHHRNAINREIHHLQQEFSVVYRLNDQGLRAQRHYGSKPPGRLRILMLGDSFTFGIGVEDHETFSARIEQQLNAEARDVEVLNAGVISYSPLLHYLALRNRYGELAPDLVMLWFDFSDLQDDATYEHHRVLDHDGRMIACHPDLRDGRIDWMEVLLRRSELVAHVHGKAEHVRWKIGATSHRPSASAAPELVEQDRYAFIRPSVPLSALERSWTRTSGYLVRIHELLQARGIPLVLVLYPYGIQVGPEQWAQGRGLFGFERGRVYDDPRPFARIEAFAMAHGIPVINAYPAFLAARDQPLFFSRDGHFTPTGHWVAASFVTRHSVFRAFVDQAVFRLPGSVQTAIIRPDTGSNATGASRDKEGSDGAQTLERGAGSDRGSGNRGAGSVARDG